MEYSGERKKALVELYVIEELCKGCGFCVEFCPTNVLKLSDGFNAKGYHPPEIVDGEACTGCNICGMICPDFAIYGILTKMAKKAQEAAAGGCASES